MNPIVKSPFQFSIELTNALLTKSMKLRLPLALSAALMITANYSYTSTYAEEILGSRTITEDKTYDSTLVVWGGSPAILTITQDNGGKKPVVSAPAIDLANDGHLFLKGGDLKLGTSTKAAGGTNYEYSLWIGTQNSADPPNSTANIYEGTLECESRIMFGMWGNKGIFRIYGGTVQASGIYTEQDTGAKSGEVWLMGGKLVIGKDGIDGKNDPTVDFPSVLKMNLIGGTLGSYESWSSTRKLILELDSVGKDLPGTAITGVIPETSASDGTHSLTIAPAQGTTITLDSKIEGTGTGNLIKSGDGTLFIKAGSVANTFTQNIVLTGGKLEIDNDNALGAVTNSVLKTITVRGDENAKGASSFDVITVSGTGEGSYRKTKHPFLIESGANFVFSKQEGSFLDLGGFVTIKSGAHVEFAGRTMFDEGAGWNPAMEKMVVESGATVKAKDTLYLSTAVQVTLSGTMTVEKSAAPNELVPDGLVIGGYHGNLWNTSKFVVEDGGFLDMQKAKVSLSKGTESGQFIINEGGRAFVQGIEDKGAWGAVKINGGTLQLGAGGIHFYDQSANNDGDGSKNGEHYLSDVYFSSGKLVINEDSAYQYTGAKEFEAINGRQPSVYTGNFFFGKDNTGALDDPNSKRTVEVAVGATFSFKEIILGDGGFNKTGAGVVTLEVANGYKGNTVVEEGSLYLGNKDSLGTGAQLVMFGGTTLAALTDPISIKQEVIIGEDTGSNQVFHWGTTTKTGALTLTGNVTLKSSINHLDVAAHTTLGDTTAVSTAFTKSGTGTLTFGGTLSGIKSLDVTAGKIAFGADATGFAGVETINIALSSGVDLGGQSGSAALNYAGAGTLAHAGAYAGTMTLGKVDEVGNVAPWVVISTDDISAEALIMNNQNARLSTTGSFVAERVSFMLGSQNDTDQVLITAGSAEITGSDKGSITLNFNTGYLESELLNGGTFQLFSTGLNYKQGSISFNQKQIIMLDTDQLSVNGSVSWRVINLQSFLLDQDMPSGTYTPVNEFDYLGANVNGGKPITVGSEVIYNIDSENVAYRLTPGKGTLIYQGVLDRTEKALYVADYSDITENADDRSAGNVTLTNNGNAYGKGTNISGTNVVVDLSQGGNPGLEGQIQNGNLNVNVLGTGEVLLTSGKMGFGSTLRLQSYGDSTLSTATTFTYANDFRLSDTSTLVQSGANDQILTGNIISESGDNAIRNESIKTLTIKGNVTQTGAQALTFENTQAGGKIVLDGSDKKLITEVLNVKGAGTLALANGYSSTVQKVYLDQGSLQIDKNSIISVGKDGVTGSGQLVLNGGTLSSASSWSSDSIVSLSGATTSTLNTGGANVKLNRGLSGLGNLEKQGSGFLYIYDGGDKNASVSIDVKQGRLILMGTASQTRAAVSASGDYILTGDLTLSSGKGASLSGMIDANNHKVNFGDKTHFYLSVSEEEGLTGYIRNANTLSFGSGTQLHVDVLDDTWVTETNYTIFSANNGITGADNLAVVLENEFAFVDVMVDKSQANEINLTLMKKGGIPGGSTLADGTNKGAIHAAVAPLVDGILSDTTSLTGNMLRTMQTVSKMTKTEYQTYLGDMSSSASSYYTALSAQVQDMTQHLNSVRNRVELINPIMYDDWQDGGIYNIWAGGTNHYRDVKSDFQAPGYKMTSWGGELGCAIPMSESFMMGVGFAYTSTEVTVKDDWGTNEGDTYNVDLFARYRQDRLILTGVLTGGFTNVDFHRNQLIRDSRTRSNSSSDGNQFAGTLEAMYDIYLNEQKSWILQPLLNLTAGRAKLDGLSETGELKNAGLAIGSQSYNMFSAGVGAKIAYQYNTEVSDHPGRVELRAMYVNDMGDTDFKVNGSFIGAPGSNFELDGVSNERSAVLISAGWIAPVSTYGQFFADASCEFRKDQTGVSSTVGFSFQF